MVADLGTDTNLCDRNLIKSLTEAWARVILWELTAPCLSEMAAKSMNGMCPTINCKWKATMDVKLRIRHDNLVS